MAVLEYPRTFEALLPLLEKLESRFPVETWKDGEVHLWPLIRYDLCASNNMLVDRFEKERPATRDRPSRLHPALARARAFGLAHVRWAEARMRDWSKDDRLGPADVLFYSDGVSFAQVDHRWVDRFCDPLIDAATELGLTSRLITPAPTHDYFYPRRSASVFLQPELEWAGLLAAARAKLQAPALSLAGYEDLVSLLRREIPLLHVPARENLPRMAVHVRVYAALFERLLRRVSPRAVMVTSYFGGERMAMLLAAHRLGIPSVDIQHGAAAAHWAYARWSRVPAGGYALLPKYFWCWDKATVAAIEAWAGKDGPHRAVLGGNPFLMQWKQEPATAFVLETERRLSRLARAHPRHTHVLYTTNGFETKAQIRALAELVRDTANQFFWWVRMHPCRLSASVAFEQAFAEVGATSYDVADASDAPLYAVLRIVAVHVTEISSTVLEAADMGVPSVLTLGEEAGFYAGLVRDGWVLPVAGIHEAADGIRRQLARRSELLATQQGSALPPTREALARIIAQPQEVSG